MAKDKTYIKGIFSDVKSGQYGEFWNLWFPSVDEFIEELRKIPTNSKGGLNLTLTTQKNNPQKGSIFVNEYDPQQGGGTSAPKRQPAPVADEDDSLPF